MNARMKVVAMGSAFALALLCVPTARAETVIGKVTFLGTQSEVADGGTGLGFQAQFRVRLVGATCGGTTDRAVDSRWIHVRSGRMDGQFAHNAANLKNAYSTLLVAFLTGHYVQIDGLASCDERVIQTIDLWRSAIAIIGP